MGIIVSIQQRLAKLQAQSMAAKAAADDSKSVSNIAFVSMAEAGTIDEITAAEHTNVFAAWQPGVSVTAGSYRNYGNGDSAKLYRCLQAHTTQEDWEPDIAVSLWKIVGDPTVEWTEWSQPIGAVDAYDAGAKVSHNGKHWTSNIDNNVWEPGIYGWTEVT